MSSVMALMVPDTANKDVDKIKDTGTDNILTLLYSEKLDRKHVTVLSRYAGALQGGVKSFTYGGTLRNPLPKRHTMFVQWYFAGAGR